MKDGALLPERFQEPKGWTEPYLVIAQKGHGRIVNNYGFGRVARFSSMRRHRHDIGPRRIGTINYLKGAQAIQSPNAAVAIAAIAAGAPALDGLTAVGVDTSIHRVTRLQLVCDGAETPGCKVAGRNRAVRAARDLPRITRSLTENLLEQRYRSGTPGLGFK